jgi:hypothetical protein
MEGTAAPRGCPDHPVTITVSYPEGVDGGGTLDKWIAALAKKRLNDTKLFLEEGHLTAWRCGGTGETYVRVTLTAFTFEGGMSVLRSREDYYGDGVGPGDLNYATSNIDLSTNDIPVYALLPDKASRQRVWERLYAAICADGRDVVPISLWYISCGRTDSLPPNFIGDRPLHAMGDALITSLGLTFNVPSDPGVVGGREGYPAVTLDIPADDLVDMGADPRFWQ